MVFALRAMQCPFALLAHQIQGLDWPALVPWAANERFEIAKFKFEFPRARTYEMIGLVLGCIQAKFCK